MAQTDGTGSAVKANTTGFSQENGELENEKTPIRYAKFTISEPDEPAAETNVLIPKDAQQQDSQKSNSTLTNGENGHAGSRSNTPPGGGGILPRNQSKSRFKVARVEFSNDPICDEPPGGAGGGGEGSPPGSENHGSGVNQSGAPATGARVRNRSRQESIGSAENTGSSSPPTSPNNANNYGSDHTSSYNTHNTHNSHSYDTHNLKTFGHNTIETLPHLDHYRNLLSATGNIRKRPTLLELHELEKEEEESQLVEAENGHGHLSAYKTAEQAEEGKHAQQTGPKFGWIKGVLVRCLLNIWGVMLFLRLSWVVGQAGIALCVAIILLSGVVTTITSLSMSAICTNGEIKGGGAYFMISRSLGPEFGGAIGLIFSVANAVAVAMYVVGFAETIRDLLMMYDMLMVDEINDVRIIGVITVIALLAIALIGMEWEARAQLVLLFILLIAIADFVIGTFIPPSTKEAAQGFVGYGHDVFVENLTPDFRDGENFFSAFAIFFPAATGILAGANISGDLQDAQKAIPKGTLWAILISTITYILMAWMAGSCVLRDAAGLVAVNAPAAVNLTVNTSSVLLSAYTISPTGHNQTSVGENGTATVVTLVAGKCTPGKDCQYGLQNDMQVMQLVSGFGPLIVAGIISATLSSALASLVSAPKVFQAVCKDKIFPGIHVFAKGYGKGDEPRRGYALAFIIGLAFICIGDLNTIAPLISNFFLMSYALINYSCFDASLAKSPGWRPAFKYYSMWISLLGAVICLGIMFVINWWAALITFALVSALYIYVHYRKPDINWGSSTQAHVYRNALQSTMKLVTVMEHVKNFRPQVLVLTGFPSDRPSLVYFASNITKNISLMVCGHIKKDEETADMKDQKRTNKLGTEWLNKHKVKSFYNVVVAPSFRLGAQALLQCAGTGKLRPNTLLVGFKSDWREAKSEDVEEYVNVIHDAFDLRYGVGVLRLKEGLDHSHISQALAAAVDEVRRQESSSVLFPCERPFAMSRCPSSLYSPNTATTPVSNVDDGSPLTPPESDAVPPEEQLKFRIDDLAVTPSSVPELAPEVQVHPHSKHINKELIKNINRFNRKQKKATIDVWWLFDDGGLTLLIPYILSTKTYWQNCKLRVFTAGSKKGELDRDQRHMATLLSKFRIEYSSMTIIPDVGKRPSDESMKEFRTMMKDWMLQPGETEDTHPWKVTEGEIATQKDKTYRHIRLRELLKQHSKDAGLIVMTLPIPRKGLCSAGLYMGWLETLTADMPPILLLRGNQESVLTYYS